MLKESARLEGTLTNWDALEELHGNLATAVELYEEEEDAAAGEISAMLAAELDAPLLEEELPVSSPAPTGMAEAETEELGSNTDDDGYEWNENPPGSGNWYYRETGSDEWHPWEQ